MNIKIIRIVEVVFIIEDLKEVLVEKLGKFKEELYIKEIIKIELYLGVDFYDVYYYDVFVGIKIIYIEQI